MTALYEQTSSLLYQINGFISAAAAFNLGFWKIINRFVIVDMQLFRKIMTDYKTFYNNTYKVVRHRAAEYVTQAIKQIQDLSYAIKMAPTSFNSFYEAQWFYTSFFSLLDKCVVNTRMASTYLMQVQNDEISIRPKNSPDRFYLDDHDSAYCFNKYSVISDAFEKIVPVLSYGSQKISQWIEINSKNITYSSAHQFSNYSSGTMIPENDNNNPVPNLWNLLACTECDFTSNLLNFSTWKNLVEKLTTPMNDAVLTCLLEYEETLELAHNASQQPFPQPPTWMLGDILSTYVTDLNLNLITLNTLLRSFLAGLTTLQETTANIDNIMKLMSKDVANIQEKILSSAVTWQSDVLNWQSDLNVLYTSIVANVVDLSQFMPINANLSAFGRSLSPWYLHKVLLNVIYYFPNEPLTDNPSLIPLFKQNLTEFLKTNSSAVINDTLSRIVDTNILYAQVSCETIEASDDAWTEYTNEVQQTTSLYKSLFTVDETFVQ